MEATAIKPPQSVSSSCSDEVVEMFLDFAENAVKSSQLCHKMKVDDHLVQSFKKYMVNPLAHEVEKIERIEKTFSYIFISVFYQQAQKDEVKKLIDKVAIAQTGTEISFWVFLSQDNWNFENRKKFYPLINKIQNSPIFKKHVIDFRIARVNTVQLSDRYEIMDDFTDGE